VRSPWNAVDDAMRKAVSTGVFPGGVLLAATRDTILFHRAYGMGDCFSRRPATRDTLYDLASLTKPLATTLAAMHLADCGELPLDQPIRDFFRQPLNDALGGTTPRMLLRHTSGLPAWRPYFGKLAGVDVGQRWTTLGGLLAEERPERPPGIGTVYSDVGFMMLQWLLEHRTGRSLAFLVEEVVYPALGVTDLLYLPGGQPIPAGRQIAATQLCPWRSRLLKGEVDDENAFILGGVAGHAGLFGTAGGVHRLLSRLTAAYDGSLATDAFSPETVRQFLNPDVSGERALGFDRPSEKDASCGRLFDGTAVGHLGFTGTSFWLNPATGLHVILLTNRGHPFRYAGGIREFRPAIHNAVGAALQK